MSDADHPSTRGGRAEGATWLGGLAALLTLTVVTVVWVAYPPAGGAEPEVGADQELAGTGGGTDLAGFRSDAWYLPDDNLGFVEIPAGSFLMGSDPALDDLAYDNEVLLSVLDLRENAVATRQQVIIAERNVQMTEKRLASERQRNKHCRQPSSAPE